MQTSTPELLDRLPTSGEQFPLPNHIMGTIKVLNISRDRIAILLHLLISRQIMNKCNRYDSNYSHSLQQLKKLNVAAKVPNFVRFHRWRFSGIKLQFHHMIARIYGVYTVVGMPLAQPVIRRNMSHRDTFHTPWCSIREKSLNQLLISHSICLF